MNRRSLLAMFAAAPVAIAASAVPALAVAKTTSMGVTFPAFSANYEYAYGQAIDLSNGPMRSGFIQPQDVGHIETMQSQVNEICRWFYVTPEQCGIVAHDLGHLPDFVPGHA